MIRILLIITGSIFVGLGVLGIFLPVLPTTPFLLAAAACYIRSSEKLYQWLINNRYFGIYIKNYRELNGIPLHAKIFGILLLWLTIGYTALFVLTNIYLQVLLFAIALGVTIYLLSLKTVRIQRQNYKEEDIYKED